MDKMKSLELKSKVAISLATREWKSWLKEHLEGDGKRQEMKGAAEERAPTYTWDRRGKHKIQGSRSRVDISATIHLNRVNSLLKQKSRSTLFSGRQNHSIYSVTPTSQAKKGENVTQSGESKSKNS